MLMAELRMIVLWMLLSLGPFLGRAQLNLSPKQLDTIYVSELMTTAMIFPEPLSLVDLGSGAFQASTHDKVLLLKAVANSYGILPTTLFIRFGSEGYFQGFIAYQAKPQEPFYDWRKIEPGSPLKKEKPAKKSALALKKEKEDSKLGVSQQDSSLLKGLNYLRSRDREYLSIRKIKDGVELSLSNIYHDSSRTYFALKLENNSSIPFYLNSVDIQLREPVKKKSLRDMVLPLEPEFESLPDKVDPYNSQMLYFVSTHRPAPKKARLEFAVREEKGTRALGISIPYTEILKAPLMP